MSENSGAHEAARELKRALVSALLVIIVGAAAATTFFENIAIIPPAETQRYFDVLTCHQ